MRVLILGGNGFLGRRLARLLQEKGKLRGAELTGICLADAVEPEPVGGDTACRGIALDLARRDAVDMVVALGWDVIFHLEEIGSRKAEEDFACGMRTNFFGTFNLFEALRAADIAPVVVYASSIAVFHRRDGDTARDRAPVDPQSSFGAQKAIGERLLCDYGRLNAFDGRALRLPAVIVKPQDEGDDHDFVSALIREPLHGRPALCPASAQTRLCVVDGDDAATGLLQLAECERDAFEGAPVATMPGLSASVADILDAIEAEAGEDARALVDIDPDAAIEERLATLPVATVDDAGAAAGLTCDTSLAAIVRACRERESYAPGLCRKVSHTCAPWPWEARLEAIGVKGR